MTKKNDDTGSESWSTGAKIGAAVGSAAIVAALLYANKRRKDADKKPAVKAKLKPKAGGKKKP